MFQDAVSAVSVIKHEKNGKEDHNADARRYSRPERVVVDSRRAATQLGNHDTGSQNERVHCVHPKTQKSSPQPDLDHVFDISQEMEEHVTEARRRHRSNC